MKYVNFGKTKEKVPAIVLGCMRLTSLSVTDATKYIEYAVSQGVNFFDHADIYGAGACGELFFSYDGKQWDKEPDVTVTAIGADANSVFAANIDGTIDQYTYDRQMEKLHRTEKIETSEKHIAELVLWGNGIGWQTADATFEVLELDENGKYKSIKERK